MQLVHDADIDAAMRGELRQGHWAPLAKIKAGNTVRKEITARHNASRATEQTQLRAEAANPKGDIWWGGTGDPHLQAAEEGLTETYKSPKMAELQDWAVQEGSSKGRTVGIYAGALGYGYNKDQLKKNMPEPKCWSDLIKPEFKDEIQVANPNSSGTAYTMLATLVQLMGEDKAFDYLKALHKNVNQYTKSGAAPASAAATGESLVGITFQHDAVVAGDRRCADDDRVAVRRHRLRDRLHEHHQGREEHGEREEMVRLGADAGSAGDRRAGRKCRTRSRRTRTRRRRRRRRSSPRSSSSTTIS